MLRGPARCCSAPRRSAASSTSSTRRIPRHAAERADRRRCAAELRLGGQRTLRQRRRRCAARRPFRRPCRRRLFQVRRPACRRPSAVRAAARAGARQPRPGHPRARRSRGTCCPTPPAASTMSPAASPMSTAISTSAFQSATTTRNTASRSASRSIPTIEAEAADDRRAPEPRRRPRRTCRSAASSSCPSSAAASPNTITTSSTPEGVSARASSRTAARCAPTSSRPSAAAGAAPAASSISNADARIRGDEKYLPDSRKQAARPVHAADLCAGRCASKAARASNSARLNADADAQIAGRERRRQRRRCRSPATSRRSRRRSARNYEVASRLARWACRCRTASARPSIDELFANGPHGGSEQFLVGDPDLELEKSNGAELSLHRTTGPVHVQGSVYYSRFSNFIFQAPTGDDRRTACRSSPIARARPIITASKLESDAKLGKALGHRLGRRARPPTPCARRSTTSARAPQIPPLRVLGGADRHARPGRRPARGRARLRTSIDTAPNETPTPGYTMVNASFDWHPFAANPELTLSLTAQQFVRRGRPRATPACSRITRRSPAATSA